MKETRKRVEIVSLKIVRESTFLYEPRKIQTPIDVVDLFRKFLDDLDRECLMVLTLDTKNQPNLINLCSVGSLNASIVHPREVYKIAVLSNAASIIIAHNHPTGIVTPSKEDISITKRLKKVGGVLGIGLLDHIILGDNGNYLSLREEDII